MDALTAQWSDACHAQSRLGTRPLGDWQGLSDLARTVRRESDTVAAAGRLQAGIPTSMVFEGPSARRFGANSGEVAQSLFATQHMLDSAVAAIEAAASDIRDAQQQFDRQSAHLQAVIDDLRRRLDRRTSP